MNNPNLKHIENFYINTDGVFVIAWLVECHVYSDSLGIIKTFSINNAKFNNCDETYISINEAFEPAVKKENLASTFKYALFVYDPDTERDYDDKNYSTALFCNDMENFLVCTDIVAKYHLANNDLQIAQNFPYVNFPRDKQLTINAITVDNREVISNMELKNFAEVVTAREKIEEILKSPNLEM